jgi:mRNA interferase HigB
VNVVSRKTLVAFWTIHPEAEAVLSAWYGKVKAAEWATTHDLKKDFGSADPIADNRVVFNVGGNNYRVVVRISFRFKQVLIKFVGTHREYDQIDATKV